MPRIPLPGDAWADLIAVEDLRAGDLKAYRRAMPVGVPLTMGVLDDMKDVLLRRVIVNWSFELPLPKDNPGDGEQAGSLDMLPLPAFRALLDELDTYTDAFNAEADPKPSSESAGTSPDSPSSSTSD
ncbi:hypothetical protein [Microtetraspora glauca]|uniref:Tail assembly chaperone n=1 Tax=Microtetraspora glauca TaxID=1996 RepID=A0ABV3GA52_MICGL